MISFSCYVNFNRLGDLNEDESFRCKTTPAMSRDISYRRAGLEKKKSRRRLTWTTATPPVFIQNNVDASGHLFMNLSPCFVCFLYNFETSFAERSCRTAVNILVNCELTPNWPGERAQLDVDFAFVQLFSFRVTAALIAIDSHNFQTSLVVASPWARRSLASHILVWFGFYSV